MDSDNEMFITQSSFKSSYQVAINSDFEDLLNSSGGEIVIPNFDLNTNGFSSSDSELVLLSQKKEEAAVNEPQTICNIPKSSTGNESTNDFSGSDSELVVLSQKIEEAAVYEPQNVCNDIPKIPTVNESRFAKPMTDSDVESLCNSALSTNTENKSKWAYNVYRSWVTEREKLGKCNDITLNADIIELSKNEMELNKVLMKFVMEVRNRKGEEYHGNTLYELVVSLQYYLRRNDVEIDLLERRNPSFKGLTNVLDARMKQLARAGIGIDRKQANVISVAQEDILWNNGILGEDTSQKLLNTMVYLIGLNCALRAGDEHRNLRIGLNSQLKISEGSDGAKYLVYTEDTSKTNRGGLNSRKCDRKIIRVSENLEQPQRCLVRLYQKYMSLRPKDGKCNAFYLRPLHYAKDEVWYADVAVGKHPLRSTVTNLCKQAGFTGFFTNHSLRATAATRLYNSGMDEQLIAERTGHRSLAIRSYKRTSAEMESRVDSIIQRKPTKATSVVTRSSTETVVTGDRESADATSGAATTAAENTPTTGTSKQLKLVLADGASLSFSF